LILERTRGGQIRNTVRIESFLQVMLQVHINNVALPSFLGQQRAHALGNSYGLSMERYR